MEEVTYYANGRVMNDGTVVQFDSRKKSNNSVYSDRLYQWDSEKYNTCCQKIWGNEGQSFYGRDAESIEKFLRLYFDNQDIVLCKIVRYENVASGYPYWHFMFNDGKTKD